ncbi:SAVED domain-containing protein [Sphingosinicella rhizophila]|uniref:SAVED domain-containing protein n=1 Tax=Sphingosinicella rhizophila TaxID=3050082 RepID=A0ABU3QAP2_9SPHN|nr:SAVED domain-containing protein [Sphingosinicella sp. GR2756]MDT9600436.1 SAVED domain-containing protein [Sphingosinicella sp. GR2756]
MLSADPKPPALTDAKGMGGVIAQDGFNYQLWDGLVRLPRWLANPAFEELIFEGLEDLEARFFAPQSPRGRLLERFQAKGGDLAPAGVREVLESFQNFEAAYPRAARVQTLVTPRLPPTVSWLGRDPARVRRARPFYAPFADVAAASDATLRARLVDTYGEPLGPFVSESVEISERNLPDRDSAVQAFGLELERAFPALEVSPRRSRDAFEGLSALAGRSVGTPISRAELRRTAEGGLGQPLPLPASFPLHIRSDRNEADETALEIDASLFSGGAASFPASERWAEDLIGPLDRTARWLRAGGVSRVALGGSYRLSTAMVVGWSLRAASGYELEIPTRDGPWLTDDRPGSEDSALPWRITEPAALDGDYLVVSIGVLRDPAADLLETAGVAADCVLSAYLPEPVVSGRAAQASASAVKRAVDAVVARLRPKEIRLFMAGPAAFAVALGHRWNAMPPTQLHEFLSGERRYVPTARLEPVRAGELGS